MNVSKVGGCGSEHLRAGPPFSCVFLDGIAFRSFFNQREIDSDCNPSGFVFFEAFLNY